MDFSGVKTNHRGSFCSENENYRVLQEKEIEEVSEVCTELPSYDSVITIGMGGSIRGSKAVTSILGSTNHYVACHPELSEMNRIIKEVSSPILHLSSKSGKTVETIAMFNYLSNKLDIEDNRVVVTTGEGSKLAELAKEEGFTLFESNSRITGRFSVFSYYGMVPSYLCGVDVSKMCSIARSAFDSNSESKRLGIGISDITNTKIFFLASYSRQMRDFNKWAEQLWSESLGKSGNGTHISTGIGPNLQHSRLQRLIDGEDNISVVLVLLQDESESLVSVNYEKTDKTSFGEIMSASFEETKNSIDKNEVSCIPVTLLGKEEDVAELMCAFEIAVIKKGQLREINTFTQEAVEGTKCRILGKVQK